MEPIPLSGGQLMLTNPDDHTLLARDPALIGGALALTLAALAGYIIQFCSALRERKPA